MKESKIRLRSGGELCYEEFGDVASPVLVLIQGTASQMTNWPAGLCFSLVDAGFRVIRFDNRDVGRSSRFPGVRYGLEDMADDVRDLLDGLGVESAIVCGQSMGGAVAQEFAIRHGGRCRALVLIYTLAGPFSVSLPAYEPVSSAEDAVRRWVEMEGHTLRSTIGNDPAFVWEQALLHCKRGGEDVDGLNRQRLAINTARDRSDDLRSLTVEALVIHGSEDPVILPDEGARLAELIPRTRLTVVPDMGHCVPAPVWPRLVEEITSFVSGLDDESRGSQC